MTIFSTATGIIGENTACGYLVQKSYKIIDRNYRTPFGEIDIIAKSIDKTLVFFEVKTKFIGPESGNSIWQSYPHSPLTKSLQFRQIPVSNSHSPEMRLISSKLVTLRKLALWYSNAKSIRSEFRIDGICVDLFGDGVSNIRHYRNIGYY